MANSLNSAPNPTAISLETPLILDFFAQRRDGRSAPNLHRMLLSDADAGK
jgi:hypothetical protein